MEKTKLARKRRSRTMIKKTNQKGKIENKSIEAVPFLEHANEKENEKETAKEGLPNKSTEKGPLKRKSGKNIIDKPLTKKVKRENSPKHLGKGDKSAQDSGQKGKKKDKSSDENAAKNAPSKPEKKELTYRHLKEGQPLKFKEEAASEKRTY
ncbi:hypothetical protein Cgig2_024759 [Carnegiea gigantea]|uniref:Uncharacterized protein n=1 Tax=Carnegiea gigantea TaxID=171969 RepID=A0A9Q1Q908_9CARY|nr:hypothetical protein Cgig2_024759 [Carnegiea gigantea]